MISSLGLQGEVGRCEPHDDAECPVCDPLPSTPNPPKPAVWTDVGSSPSMGWTCSKCFVKGIGDDAAREHLKACYLPPAADPVHPPHYTALSIQPIEVIESWALGFNLGTVVKYIGRAGRKGDALTDLKKAQYYLEREISHLEKAAK